MTDNLPETDDYIEYEGQNKYWGQGKYNNVTLHLDETVWKTIKLLAVQQETTIRSMVNEALATWIKWLRKAEQDEKLQREMAGTEGELREAEELLAVIMAERDLPRKKRQKVRRTQEVRQRWHKRFPGMVYRGKKFGKDALRETNNLPGTDNTEL